MKIQYTLTHPISGTKADFVLHNADPGGLVKVIQEGGVARANQVAQALAREKMPTWLYQYDVTDWSIVDEDAPATQKAAA
jgi:hypothetical protein